MAEVHELNEAQLAIDWLLARLGHKVDKADPDPLTKEGITQIAVRLASAIRGKTKGAEANAMRAAISQLDVNWPALSNEGRERVLTAAKAALFTNVTRQALPVIDQEFQLASRGIYKDSKRQTILRHKLNIPFVMNSLDKDLARHVSTSNVNFVRNEYGARSERMSEIVRGIVARGTERGAGAREMVKEIKDRLGSDLSKIGRGDHYWEMASLAFANRARNYAALESINESGFSRYVWESVLDERTTETCRFFHGKTFPVEGALDTFRKAEAAENPEDIKQVQPWISQGVDEDGNAALFSRNADGSKNIVATIQRPGIGVSDRIGSYSPKLSDAQLLGQGFSMPPIHGLCRSTVLPDVSSPPPGRKTPAIRIPPTVPRGVRGPKMAKQGKHFTMMLSDLPKDLERDVLATFDDIGTLPYLERAPLGMLVASKLSRRKTLPFDPYVPTRANGVYYSGWHDNKGKETSPPSLKLLSKDSKDRAGSLSAAGAAPFSVPSTMKTSADQIKANLIHETGHHVHLHGRRVHDESGRFERPSMPEYNKVDRVVSDAFRQHRLKKLPSISRYSETNRKEFFAEAFTYHALEPEILKQRNPVAFDMVEEVRKIRGLGEINRDRLGRLSRTVDTGSTTKADPKWEALFKITREAERLDDAGRLTLEKIEAMEAQAAAVAGDFGDWRESFADYRWALEYLEASRFFA